MRAAALLAAFVLAKGSALAASGIRISDWTLIAYFWQDTAVALGFAALDGVARARRRPRGIDAVASVVYWLLVALTVLNVPVQRALFTPITWPMAQAAAAPLADSMRLYLTFTNVTLMAATVGVALIPVVLRTRAAVTPRRMTLAASVAAVLTIAAGPLAAARVDTIGLDRNVLVAFASTLVPRIDARAAVGDWRLPLQDRALADDLSGLRSIAAGRNVVLVSLESTGAEYLPMYGGDPRTAPHLAALAREGLVVEHAYAAYPESIKGLFSVLCSTFPVFDTTADELAQTRCDPLPGRLAAAGYRTGLFHSGRFDYLGMQSVIRHRGYHTLEDAGDVSGVRQSSFGVGEEAMVARMLAWIDAGARNTPFFLTYLPIAGHHPYESPGGPFPIDDDIGRYQNALRYGDAALGRLIEGIASRGLAAQTIWIVAGDHGEAFGRHQGNYGHTFFLYEENVRVPLVIAIPGATLPASRTNRVVSLVDLAPTVLDLLGLPATDSYQGESIVSRRRRMALFVADYSLGLAGLRDGRWKFIHELGSDRSRLFDLEIDRFEQTNLASAQTERVNAYRRHLLDWSAAQKAALSQDR